jgi:prolyl-tRNA editing enzyme YbaK/EbsC (Cys-tRNA(Pro) deacylase)
VTFDDEVDPEEVERAVLAHADALGVDYEAIRIDPAFAATADFCAEYGYTMEESANCIVVATKTGERRYAACLVQATRRLDVNGTVRKRLGARKVSFAPPEDTVELTGQLPNGVTPLALPDDLPLWIDAGVMGHDRVIIGGGSLSLKLYVPSAALAGLPGAEVVEGLARPPG